MEIKPRNSDHDTSIEDRMAFSAYSIAILYAHLNYDGRVGGCLYVGEGLVDKAAAGNEAIVVDLDPDDNKKQGE